MNDIPTIKAKRRLLNGRMMMCPRCEKDFDLLRFVPLRMIKKYIDETTPIYRCPGCQWNFAPSDNIVRQFLEGLKEESEVAA